MKLVSQVDDVNNTQSLMENFVFSGGYIQTFEGDLGP